MGKPETPTRQQHADHQDSGQITSRANGLISEYRRPLPTLPCTAGVSRIIDLGGLRRRTSTGCPALRSRAEAGDILLGSGVPTAMLRAGVII
jgi:hypothetical protein